MDAAQIRRVIFGAVKCEGANIPRQPQETLAHFTQEYHILHRLRTVSHNEVCYPVNHL